MSNTNYISVSISAYLSPWAVTVVIKNPPLRNVSNTNYIRVLVSAYLSLGVVGNDEPRPVRSSGLVVSGLRVGPVVAADAALAAVLLVLNWTVKSDHSFLPGRDFDARGLHIQGFDRSAACPSLYAYMAWSVYLIRLFIYPPVSLSLFMDTYMIIIYIIYL